MTRFWAVTGVLAGLSVMCILPGCKKESATQGTGGGVAKAAAVNTVCPISQDAVNPTIVTRTFEGKTVGFCCPACPPAWDKLTDAEKKAKLAAAMAAKAPAGGGMGNMPGMTHEEPATQPAAPPTTMPVTKAVNGKCPILGGAVSLTAQTRVFQGKTIGFCCDGCQDQWDKLTDAEKQAKLDAVMPKPGAGA